MSTQADKAIDRHWMRFAIKQARRGQGLTRPNPPVGAVIVSHNKLIATGTHTRAGGPHAEIKAIRKAAGKTRGATIYVTLEPCSTVGRTGPCVEALIAAGISRVVVGVRDPNPAHAGRGLTRLRRAGIQVTAGVERRAAAMLIEPFTKWITTGRPFVTLKLGLTIDGRIADRNGESRWITSPASREFVQGLRTEVDAVLIGRETARLDNPALTVKTSRRRSPDRIVVATAGALSTKATMLTDDQVGKTIIATTTACSKRKQDKLTSLGAQVWTLPSVNSGVAIGSLLQRLGDAGYLHILCEGGGELAASLIEADAIDRFYFIIAPRLLGADGRAAIGGGWSLHQAPGLVFAAPRRLGADVILEASPQRRSV